jgi:hypothetical protein
MQPEKCSQIIITHIIIIFFSFKMTHEIPPTYRLVLDFPVVNRKGQLSLRSMVYGGKNRIRPYHEESLRQAHQEVISSFTPEELTAMGIPVIRGLTHERYKLKRPERLELMRKQVKKIKDTNPNPKNKDKKVPDKDNTITKNNITLIDPSSEGGSTAFLVGGSMSGKTTLIVQSLINILKDKILRDRYNIIIIFSESLSALPLKDLPHRKDLKIQIFPFYIPDLVKLAQKINFATNNRYGFYFFLDDCNELRGDILKRQILQMRNAGISTLVSTQYVKNIGPGPRQSFHHIYITGARQPGDRDLLNETFVSPYMRDKGITTKEGKDQYLRDHTRIEPREREIIHINSILDELNTHIIKK